MMFYQKKSRLNLENLFLSLLDGFISDHKERKLQIANEE